MVAQLIGGVSHPPGDRGNGFALFATRTRVKIHQGKMMSDTAIADVCQRCKRELLLLHWSEHFDLLVCDNFCCNLFRVPVGHIPKNGNGPDPESNRPGVTAGMITLPGRKGVKDDSLSVLPDNTGLDSKHLKTQFNTKLPMTLDY